MQRQVRRGVFETNSSSVHALTMCTQEEYDRWKQGELLLDTHSNDLVELKDVNPEKKYRYETIEEYDQNGEYYETFHYTKTTPSGDVMVVFGYHGNNN